MRVTRDDVKASGYLRDCALLTMLAFLLRLVYLLALPRVIDSADAIHYIETAKHLASGDFLGFNAKIPILYPLLTALCHLAVSDYELAGKLVSLAASTFLVIPVYALSRELHGRKTARIAAVAIALWPWLIDYATRIGPDALACTLWFACVWLLAQGLRTGGAWLVAAPFAFFALHLTRAEGTFFLLCAPIGGIILYAGEDKRKLYRLIPFALACGALLLGYALFAKLLIGKATISYRGELILHEFELTLRVFKLFARTFIKVLFEVYPLMLGPVLLLFMGVGFFQRTESSAEGVLGHPRRARLEIYVLYFGFLQWFMSMWVLSPEPRYQMSVLVALSLWSARGIAITGEQAATLPRGRCLRLLPMAALVSTMLLGTAVSMAAVFLESTPREPWEYKAAGAWMREHVEPGLIFTRKPQVGYYAGMPTTGPARDDTLDGAIARAKEAGARYLVIDERYTARMAPGMAPLLEPSNAPRGLRLLKEIDDYPGARVVVYEMADAL